MEILFLSHCVPNPPDKGEKIRAYHEVRELAKRGHRVHVGCFARGEREVQQAEELRGWCASVHVEPVKSLPCLAQAAVAYAMGGSLNYGFYRSSRMAGYARSVKADCALVYSVVMGQFVPPDMPYVLDMIDVDSEKWHTFAETRFPNWFFRTEAERLRRREIEEARGARVTYLATANERDVFRKFAGSAGTRVEALPNGVDGEYYDPAVVKADSTLAGRKFLVFTGAFNSFANVDGAEWFVNEVFPAMRGAVPGLELFLVGMNPSAAVVKLGSMPGLTVTGYVEDTRPYLRGALAVVAPLRVARGIQNKVLEGLAMGRKVLVSPAVGKTFGGEVPEGVVVCGNQQDWVTGLGVEVSGVREGVLGLYSWDVLGAGVSKGVEG